MNQDYKAISSFPPFMLTNPPKAVDTFPITTGSEGQKANLMKPSAVRGRGLQR